MKNVHQCSQNISVAYVKQISDVTKTKVPKQIFIFSDMDHFGSSHLTSKHKLVIKLVGLHNAKRYVVKREMVHKCLHFNVPFLFVLYNTCIIQINKIDNITIYAYEFSTTRAPELCESLSIADNINSRGTFVYHKTYDVDKRRLISYTNERC